MCDLHLLFPEGFKSETINEDITIHMFMFHITLWMSTALPFLGLSANDPTKNKIRDTEDLSQQRSD